MIDRRTFLRSTAGVATLGGMAVATAAAASVPTMSAELVRRIAAHEDAHAAMHAFNNALAPIERAFYADRTDEAAKQAKEAAYARQNEFMDAERAAFCALLSYPFQNIAELRAVVAIGRKAWWNDSEPEEEELDALFTGIMGEIRT